MVVVAVVLTAATLGCCTVCPQATTHAMGFGARAAGCGPGEYCVCAVPEEIRVEQGDKIWFINTSERELTITTQAGTFEAGDEVKIDAKDAVLVTVSDEADVGDFDLFIELDPPGQDCPSLASPRIIVDQKQSD